MITALTSNPGRIRRIVDDLIGRLPKDHRPSARIRIQILPGVSQGPLQAELLDQTNATRQKYGLRSLFYVPALADAASAHAAWLLTNNQLSHDQDQRTFQDRSQEIHLSYTEIAEALARGTRSPEETLKAWLNSRPHRAILLNPNHNGIGFGTAGTGPTATTVAIFVTLTANPQAVGHAHRTSGPSQGDQPTHRLGASLASREERFVTEITETPPTPTSTTSGPLLHL